MINSASLSDLARRSAELLGLELEQRPARFRDETAWAGMILEPWANSDHYPPGCEQVLHFFVAGGRGSGPLHSREFRSSESSVQLQVGMLSELAANLV